MNIYVIILSVSLILAVLLVLWLLAGMLVEFLDKLDKIKSKAITLRKAQRESSTNEYVQSLTIPQGGVFPWEVWFTVRNKNYWKPYEEQDSCSDLDYVELETIRQPKPDLFFRLFYQSKKRVRG